MKTKKSTNVYNCLFILILISILVTGCDPYARIRMASDGVFRYTYLEEESGYEINSDFGVTLKGVVNVPSSYNGIPVVRIGGLFCGKDVTGVSIPSSIRIISPLAFYSSEIKKLIIPDGVEIIESCAFSMNKSLEEVFIPSTVTSIGADAFKSCSSLKKLVYGGTMEEWDKIYKNRCWRDWIATDRVICSDGVIIFSRRFF